MRLDPIRQTEQASEAPAARLRKTGDTGFQDALRQAAAGGAPAVSQPRVEFSKHASERLEQRGIDLTDNLVNRLSDGVDRAAAKGSKTTLVLVDETAFVVGVDSRTVVTVADQASLRERVFTNIDSMVIS